MKVVDSGVRRMEGARKNPTLICAPIMADTVDQMLNLMRKAKASEADLVEIRLDSLKSFNPRPDISTLIHHCPLPTLFTYRFSIFLKKILFVFAAVIVRLIVIILNAWLSIFYQCGTKCLNDEDNV